MALAGEEIAGSGANHSGTENEHFHDCLIPGRRPARRSLCRHYIGGMTALGQHHGLAARVLRWAHAFIV
jgi:hypothetical protein